MDPYDLTARHRLTLLVTDDDSRCFGCGDALPADAVGRGTSRFSPKPTVHLCSGCCTVEAFKGDAFKVRDVTAEYRRRWA